jgi:release factor glutamine methyltransferase
MTTLDQALQDLRRRFHLAGIDGAAIDARILIAGLLDLEAAATITQGGRPLSDAEAERIEAAARRRLAGEPAYRILGHRPFFTLDLALSAETLEPRADTEILVEAMLPFVKAVIGRKGEARILDLGTGTGAIALALLAAAPEARALATDISDDALKTARANAARHGLSDRFSTLSSDWFAGIEGRYDVVVSNPPYIASDVIATLADEVRLHDPMAALDGGVDGLYAYRAMARDVAAHLAPDGVMGLEIGFDQKGAVTTLFESAGFVRIRDVRDLAGHDRVLVFEQAGSPVNDRTFRL